MKNWFNLCALLCSVILSVSLSGCSSDDEDSEPQVSTTQLVGSQWERSYSWMDSDDLAWEKGKGVLTFTSSSLAEEIVTYNGQGYQYNYDLDFNEYKSYSGKNTIFYTYKVSGNQIILKNEEDGTVITAVLSGNKLKADNSFEWTMVKAGSDNDEEESQDNSYSWANMSGVWMQDLYDAYASEIQVYKSQNSTSSVYLNNSYNGNFRVWGMQFNQDGQMREVDVQFKTFHNTGALVFETIYTSDRKTVYWTDVSKDSYGDKYIIRGNEIYLNGKLAFTIYNDKMLIDAYTDNMYVKVQ